MRDWLPHREAYLACLLEREAPPLNRQCTRCHSAEGDWRCLECYGCPVTCQECCQISHSTIPLHRVEKWSGDFFSPAWLNDAGVRIWLGHQGKQCAQAAETESREHASPELEVRDQPESPVAPQPVFTPTFARATEIVVIVDVTGVHEIGVGWCSCPNATSPDKQLLAMGLYPGSTLRPRTAFTFRVLDDFLLTNKECKTSAMSYYSKLTCVTNNAFPDRVPVGPLSSRTSIRACP